MLRIGFACGWLLVLTVQASGLFADAVFSGGHHGAGLRWWDTGGVEPLVQYTIHPGYVQDVAVDLDRGKLYWTQPFEADRGIWSFDYIEPDSVPKRVFGTIGMPWGIAVDDKDGKVYFSDYTSGSVHSLDVTDEDHPVEEILLKDLSGPREIEFDRKVEGEGDEQTETATVFWVENGTGKIRKWDVGTAGRGDLIQNHPRVTGMALDKVNEHLYWAEESGSIWQADLHGGNEKEIFGPHPETHPVSVTVDTDKGLVYWADFTPGVLHALEENGDGTWTDSELFDMSRPIGLVYSSELGSSAASSSEEMTIPPDSADGPPVALSAPGRPAQIPEPATLVLLAAGGLWLLAFARKRRES